MQISKSNIGSIKDLFLAEISHDILVLLKWQIRITKK